jgi:hypothetical protein
MAAEAQKAIYDPAPVQQEFHVCPANEILLGGAAGPGKSLALLMDPIQTQLVHEHQRWLESGGRHQSVGWAIHFRREFPRLEQTMERAQRMFRALDPGARYDSQRHMWTFSCGYKLQFGHMKNVEDRFNYISNEYTHIAWDEVCEFDFEQYQYVNTRLRTSDHELQTRLRIVAATNPDGNWVRGHFVDPAPKGRVLITKSITMDDGSIEKRSRMFIPATLKDNPDPAFQRRYEIELQDKPAHIRQALLYGDWYVVAGAFFAEEFDASVHVVKPFKIPSGWQKFRSMDWGYKSPGVVLWWAVDTDNNLVCYREFNFRNLDASEVAAKVKEIEKAADEWDERKKCSRISGPADTQIWEQRGTIGPTIAESMGLAGVYWEKCTKNRLASVQQFISRLKDRTGEQKLPAIRFFDTCRNTIRTIPAIGTDASNAELPKDGGDDHWLDTVLYACMYRTTAAKRDEMPHSRDYYDELAKAREKRADRKGKGGRYGYGSF